MELKRIARPVSGLLLTALICGSALAGEGGDLRVKATLGQPAPPLPVVVTDKNIDFCGSSLEDPVLVAKDGLVVDAVVWVEWDGQSPAYTPPALELKGRNCLLVPRVQTARSGATLTLGSSDGITHNPHGWWNDERTVFNLTLISPEMSFRRRLPRAGRYRVDCDTHRWMKAYIHIFDHPYHAVSNGSAGALIENLPEGRHSVRVWHEILGEHQYQVEVEPGRETLLEVELPLRDHRKLELIPPLQEGWPPNSKSGGTQP